MTPEENSQRKGVAESLAEVIKKHGTQEFAQAKKGLARIHLGKAEEAFIARLAEALANSFVDGFLELSVEEVAKTKEYADALSRGERELTLGLSRKLPALKAYVEFVFAYGSLELSTIRYEFKLDSRIAARNIKVVIEGRRISYISFGTVNVALTVSLCTTGFEVELGTLEKQLTLEYRWNIQRQDIGLETEPKLGDQIGSGGSETVFCQNCGAEIQNNEKFCGTCGTDLDRKSKVR